MKKIKKQLDNIIKNPLDGSEFLEYLNNPKILTYSDLNKFNNIEDLLKNEKDYCIILYRQTPTSGHWISIDRLYDTISYFDPYGKYIDEPLTWNTPILNKKLGQSIPLLSNLFDKTDLDVYYNNHKYQKLDDNINTCGRWCILRILSAMRQDMDLTDFYEMIKELTKYKELTSDEIVSLLVNVNK